MTNADEEKPTTQVDRILAKFGGAAKLEAALALLAKVTGEPRHKRSKSRIYRWNHSRSKDPMGCGGLVPTSAWPSVMAAARMQGLVLDADTTSPMKG